MSVNENIDKEDAEEAEDWEQLESTADEDLPSLKILSEIIADPGQEPLRIDKFLMNRLESATRNKLQQAIEAGWVLVNQETIKPNFKVKAGDHIIVYDTRKTESTEVLPENLPLNIFYEDEHVLIINKEAGMVVHPGSGNYSGTLVNGLSYYLQKGEDEMPRIGLVHRIDKDTTGLIAVAKNESAMASLAAQFKKHTVHRRYIALVWGDVENETGRIEANIGRHLRFRKRMAAYPEGDHGKVAVTHYKVLERFHYVTLVELQLETGRTHQIRVHMKLIGHPLFNDSTYGGNFIVKGTVFNRYKQFVENCFQLMPHQALHAKELGFQHPHTQEMITFSSDLPENFEQLLEKWRTYVRGIKAGKDKIPGQ